MHLHVATIIHATPETCFDLARDVEIHTKTTAHTSERVIAGRTQGQLELGDDVTFEARHFGIRQQLSAKITEFQRPDFFVDEMTKGAFKRLRHIHRFESVPEGTRMTDEMDFVAPFPPLAWLIERLLLAPYLKKFLHVRGQELKKMAESNSRPF